ncbi:putative phylloplanin [Helianthus annuus]|uniref:Phylloplanin n=1 Tax=Helianthus annuus TaxID=4232 RepID=A0A251VK41_HELAN|nr:phylloplanin [Helianthus annuus]KAF5798808.1 putative phylloplanin [Helianthus annuus]KAJ0557064.1 putative phylloplanin [Helianthus annuus]KAJ0904909.1 putative phylloplanin [Helianthus annuus]
MKSIILITIFVVVLGSSQTKAQLPSLSLNNDGLVNVSGIIYCSVNSTIVVNGSNPTPPFPNALVLLVCGENLIASTMTNGIGAFNITLRGSPLRVTSLLSSCKVVVATPPSICNAALPAKPLKASLRYVGSNIVGLSKVTTLTPKEPFTCLVALSIRLG